MKEKNFTSNVSKLYANIDHFAEFKKTGNLSPITLDISPTNACNLNCPFCSVAPRDRSLSLTLNKVISTVSKMVDEGLKSILLTGGGEPTLWEHFEKFIKWIKIRKIPVGLITNGLKLHTFSKEILETFTWIRISLNGMDNDWFPEFIIPESVDLSFNYVWHDKSLFFRMKENLNKILEKYPQTQAIKIQRDIYEENYYIDFDFEKSLFKDSRIFVSKKNKEVPKKCYMGWVKPHLDADGFIYRCSTMVLKKENIYIVGENSLYTLKPDSEEFDTSSCEICFFKDQNDFIDQINKKIKHDNFI